MLVRLVLSAYRILFARPVFRRWNTALFHLSLRGLGVLNFASTRHSGEAYLLRTVLPPLLGPTPVVLDVGAHVGEYSEAILRNMPGATVHAFEPQPRARERWQIPATDRRVTLHPYAVGRERGRATLFDRADADGSDHATLYQEVITDIHGQDVTRTDVEIRTLDEITDEIGISAIDLLKLDVEGHELAVLEGAGRLIAGGAIRFVQFEFNDMNLVSRAFMRDFRRLLADHDFFRLLPQGLLQLDTYPLTTELFAYQNVLAAPKGAVSEGG